MQFMVIVPANEESEAGVLPTERQLAEMGKFNEELVQAGMMLAGAGLHDSSKGARIHFAGGTTTVEAGPFRDAKGRMSGYWLIRADSLAEAVRWMRRAPFGDGVALEIRQVFEADDFGPAMTPDLREQEARLHAQTESNAGR